MFRRKPVWTALAVIAILAIALSFTPVRAWASSFLGLFRVERIAVVQFDPDTANSPRDRVSANKEAMKQVLDQYLEVSGGGDVQEVHSVEEAASAAGFTPRIPASMIGAKLAVKPAEQARFTINQPVLQDLANVMEANVTIPSEVDGKVISMDIPAGVIATINCDPAEAEEGALRSCISLIQMPSPTVETPPGLDVPAMGEAMLQFLGISPEEARAYSQKIDWTSTLILPIPQGQGIQVNDVTIDGVPGTLITEEGQSGSMLLWVKNDFVYALHVPLGMEQALEMARSLP